MAVFNNGPSAAPMPAGGGGSADFSNMSYQDLYNYIASRASADNGFGGYQVAPEYQGGIAYNNQGWNQDNGGSMFNQPETREATDTERMFARLGEIGETIADPLGFGQARQDYGAFDPRTLGAFIPSLPGGIASAPFSAASKGYEAATGTNVESMNWDDNTISNEKLDSNQRAAVGADAVIDIAGTLTGGSGRLISAGVNAGRMAAGRGAEPILKGWASRAGAGWKGQLASDIAEEGGEEFVQSLLGDVRHEQLDEGSLGRALEGAAWGAAGGALMSGGGIALNRAMYGPDAYSADENAGSAKGNDIDTTPTKYTPQAYERELNRNNYGSTTVASAREYLLDQRAKDRQQPASASLLAFQFDHTKDLSQIGVGSEDLRFMYESDIEGTKDYMARSFAVLTDPDNEETTKAEIAAMRAHLDKINDSRMTFAQRALEYNKLIKAKRDAGQEVHVTIGRNPVTNDTGHATIDIDSVHAGRGVHGQRMLWKMFGADVDGDKAQLWFSPQQSRSYLVHNMFDTLTKKANIDKDYVYFSRSKDAYQNIRKEIPSIIYGPNTVSDTGSSEVARLEKLLDRAYDQSSGSLGDDDHVDALAEFFQMLTAVAEKTQVEIVKGTKPEISNRELRAIRDNVARRVSRLWQDEESKANVFEIAFDEGLQIAESLNDSSTKVLEDGVNRNGNKYVKQGRLGGMSFAQIGPALGYRICNNTIKGNPFFRQNAQIYHESKMIDNLRFDGLTHDEMVDVFMKVMAYSYRLRDVGADVESAIEGTFILAVQDNWLKAGSKVESLDADFSTMLDEFCRIYDEQVERFNEAFEVQTTRGVQIALDAPRKKTISNASQAEKARAFMDVFEGLNIEELVHLSENDTMYRGNKLGDIVEDAVMHPGAYAYAFDYIPGFKNFFPTLVKDYGGRGRAVGVTIENVAKEIAKKTSLLNLNGKENIETVERDGEEVRVITDHGMVVYAEIVDMFNLLLTPKVGIRLNLSEIESFVNTRWGKALLSGNVDQILHAIVSIQETHKWSEVFDIIETSDVSDPNVMRNIKAKAWEIATTNKSLIDEMIQHNIEFDDSLAMLNAFTSMDFEYGNLVELFESVQVNNLGRTSLITEAYKSGDEEMEISKISQNIKNARRSLNNAMRTSKDYCERVWSDISKKMNNKNSPYNLHNVVGALKTLCDEAYVTFSEESITAFVHGQRNNVKKEVEKGTSTTTADAIFQFESEVKAGNMMSWLDQMSAEVGTVVIGDFVTNRRQLMSVINDPKARYRCASYDRDGYVWLDQKSLFKEYGMDISDNGPDDSQYYRLVSQCIPQIASFIAPQSVDVYTVGEDNVVKSGFSSPLDATIDDFVNNGIASRRQDDVMARNIAMQTAMDSPQWWGALIGSIKGVGKDMTLQQCDGLVMAALEKHRKFILAYASLDDGANYKQKMSDYYGNEFTSLVDAIEDLMVDLQFAEEVSKNVGSIEYGIHKSIVAKTMGLLKTDNVSKLLEASGVRNFVTLPKGNDIMTMPSQDYDAMLKAIEGRSQEFINLIKSTLFMFDSNEMRGASLFDSDMHDDAIMQSIDNAIAAAENEKSKYAQDSKTGQWVDPNTGQVIDQKTIDDLNDRIKKLEDVKAKAGRMSTTDGIVDMFRTIFKTPKTTEAIDDYAIPESAYGESVDKFIARAEKIINRYGNPEDFKGFEEDIRDIWSDTEVTRDMVDMRRRFNGIIHGYHMKQLIQGFGKTINPDAVHQELEARRTMIDVAEKVKVQLAAKNIALPVWKGDLPPIDFHFDDPAVAMMASSGISNSQSASVSSGIGVNGAMTKLLGAIGALSPNIAGTRPFGSNFRANRVAHECSLIANWMQEAKFLQAKKTLGGVFNVADEFVSDPQFVNFMNVSKAVSPEDAIYANLEYIRERLRNHYREKFNGAKKFPFEGDQVKEVADDFAWFTTPIVEVMFSDGETIIVDSCWITDPNHRNDENLSYKRFQQKIAEGLTVEQTRVPICSMMEIASKITRGLSRNYFEALRTDPDSITIDKIHDWADDAYYHWDSYNPDPNGKKKGSISNVFDRIVPRAHACVVAQKSDFNPTPAMLFDENLLEGMRTKFTTEISQKAVPMEDNAVRSMADAHIALTTFNGEDPFGGAFMVARYTTDDANEAKRPLRSIYESKVAGASSNIDGTESYVTSNGNEIALVNLYDGDDVNRANKAAFDARKKGRMVLVKKNVAESMTAVSEYVKKIAVEFRIGQETYVGLRTDLDDVLGYVNADGSLLSQTPLDAELITTAIADAHYLQFTDSATQFNPEYEVRYHHTGKNSMVVKNALGGTASVSIVTDQAEIASITEKDLVMDYYKRLKDNRVGIRVEEAMKFVKDNAGLHGTTTGAKTNVVQGSCIGFLKQIQYGKAKYVPVFYEGSVPAIADRVSFELSKGQVEVSYETDNLDYVDMNTVKFNIYGIDYKTTAHVAPAEQDGKPKEWFACVDRGLGLFGRFKKLLKGPEAAFDANALSSRVFGIRDNIVNTNLFFGTRKVGGNLFFEQDANGDWVYKNGLNRSPNPNGVTDDDLKDLVNGVPQAWLRVANGELKLFENVVENPDATDAINKTIANITNDILRFGGDPVVFWCPSDVSMHEDGKWHFNSRNNLKMTFQMFLKSYDRNQVLQAFHMINSKICPCGTKIMNPDLKSADDPNDIKVYDEQGCIYCTNALSEAGTHRFLAITAPHYFTSDGTAELSPSSSAAYSYQAMVKNMLDLGVYPPSMTDLLSFYSMNIGIERNTQEDIEDRVRKMEFGEQMPKAAREAATKVSAVANDPMVLLTARSYRRRVNDLVADNHRPMGIVLNDMRTPYVDDVDRKLEVDNKRKELNAALGFTVESDMLTLDEISILVKYVMGFTNNDGSGFQSCTVDQFTKSVDWMIRSIDKGVIIENQKYFGTRNDVRVSIPLLPVAMSKRLFMSPVLRSKCTDEDGKPSFEVFRQNQRDQLNETIRQVETVENKAKKTKLRQFIDGVAFDNGWDSISEHLLDDVYMPDLIEAEKKFGAMLGYDYSSLVEHYESLTRLDATDEMSDNQKYIQQIRNLAESRRFTKVPSQTARGGEVIIWKADDKAIGEHVLRELAAARKCMGMSYMMLAPANVMERTLNQGVLSIQMAVGKRGFGPFRAKHTLKSGLTREVSKRDDVIEFWAAMRIAEMAGLSRDFFFQCRTANDIKGFINDYMSKLGKLEQFQNKVMDIASGGRIGISKQIQNFLDDFARRSSWDAEWWWQPATKGSNSVPIIQQKMEENPVGFLVDIFGGNGVEESADVLMANQSKQLAYSGDNAQKNIASVIQAEYAARSAKADLGMAVFVAPYFQYATNRLRRISKWVGPVSTIEYLLVDGITHGKIGEIELPGLKGLKLNELAMADLQVHRTLRDAIMMDVMHLGPMNVAFILLGLAGAVEPPEDEKKWGDFREWSYFGFRGELPWWLEDCMGLAMPYVAFGKSCQLGKPRIDLLFNGLSYYLGNNPAVKVVDAIQVLFDPFSELYRDYENDVEGYAKAMGGPPSFTDMVTGKATSFGLSLVSQFITPGFVREIYNEGQRYGMEKSYKKVYEQDATGSLSEAGRDENRLQYTDYADAMVRKYTKNNPVMGWLANIVLKGPDDTGYLASQMPNVIYYDPAQMNSVEAFSLYYDPWTKQEPKSKEECDAIAVSIIAILEGHDVEELSKIGFMLDYDTRSYVSQYIWDQIATMNDQYYELDRSGALDCYVAGDGDWETGKQIVDEIKHDHFQIVDYYKTLYYDKLWNDDLTDMVQYNRRATSYRVDSDGNYYASGFRRSGFFPTLAPSETPGDDYKFVGPHEADWQTESVVTGAWTGQRGLVPVDTGYVTTPDIESWSTDGTDTGHSARYGNGDASKSTNTTNGTNGTGSRGGSRGGYGYSRGGGGGGRRGGGGGGGSSPNIYSRVSTPNVASAKTMNTTRNQNADFDYLRPSFQTKGSREAYRREDI